MTFKKKYATISLLNNILQLNYKFMETLKNKKIIFLIDCFGYDSSDLEDSEYVDNLIEENKKLYLDYIS